jgi:hypothetical protein
LAADSDNVRTTEPAANAEDGVSGATASTVVMNHVDVSLIPDAEYVNTQGVRFTTHSGTANEGLSSA